MVVDPTRCQCDRCTGARIDEQRTEIRPLPGDADTVLDFEMQRLERRDNRPNEEENRVLVLGMWCEDAQLHRWHWKCTHAEPCCYHREMDLT